MCVKIGGVNLSAVERVFNIPLLPSTGASRRWIVPGPQIYAVAVKTTKGAVPTCRGASVGRFSCSPVSTLMRGIPTARRLR